MTLLERMIRAACEAAHEPLRCTGPNCGCQTLPRQMRAAIAAARVPTEGMVKAGDDAQTEDHGPDTGTQVAMSSRVPWQAMIDYAKDEVEQTAEPPALKFMVI